MYKFISHYAIMSVQAYETFSSSGIHVAGWRTCSYTGGNWTATVSGVTGDVGAEVGGHFPAPPLCL